MADPATAASLPTADQWSDLRAYVKSAVPSAPTKSKPTYDPARLRGALGLDALEAKSAAEEEGLREMRGRMAFPDLKAPPPQQPSDPVQAFGQPAMWIAIFGSMLTRRPLATAAKAAANVLESTAKLDAQAAKQAYDTWQIERDNAVKLVEYEQQAYRDALTEHRGTLAEQAAKIRTAAAVAKNPTLLLVFDTEGHDGATKWAAKYDKSAKAVLENVDAADRHVTAAHDLVQAAAKAPQDGGASLRTQMVKAMHDPDPKVQALGLQVFARNLERTEIGKVPPAERAKMEGLQTKIAGIVDDLNSGVDTRVEAARKAASQIEELGPALMSTARPKTGDTTREALVKAWQDAPEADKPAALKAIADYDLATKPGAAVAVGVGDVKVLSNKAAEQAAMFYLRTGAMPAGFGGQAMRKQILEAAKDIAESEGKTVDDYLSGRASLKADTASLAAVTKQKNAAEGYERGAMKSLDLMVSLIPPTPEPLEMQSLTRWVRTGATEFGDITVPPWQAALITSLDQYAKVLSGATGAQGSTDSARALALSLIPAGSTSDQIKPIVSVLRQDMNYKVAGYDTQIADIKKQIAQPDSGPAPLPDSSDLPDAARAALQEGHETTFGNGQVWTLHNGQPMRVR